MRVELLKVGEVPAHYVWFPKLLNMTGKHMKLKEERETTMRKKKTFSQYFLIVIAAHLENVVSFKTPRNILYSCKRLMV